LAREPAMHAPEGVVPLNHRDAALLAWLALEGPTPRGRLATLLWPDSPQDTARNALRQRVFKLRKLAGVEVVVGSATLALADAATHDLHDADTVLGERHDEIGGEFGQWLAQQRERRRQRIRQGLIELGALAEGGGDYADALTHAQELLVLEPLSEEAHRRVIRLHYLAGDRAAALLGFDRCEQVLKDEVGIRPSAETLALLRTIEQGGAVAGQLPVAQQAPASVLRPPRLIGRDAEHALLAQGLKAGQVVALIGEAGMGKTRLLQEFMAAQPGLVRAAGRPGDAGVPLATLARLLRAVMAGDVSKGGAHWPTDTRSELARVLPELEVAVPRAAGEGQRLVMQRAISTWLASRPGLAGLVVDDLHFADEASVELLGALVNDDTPAAAPLRWVLAYRPAEAASPARALHDALVDEARLLPVVLAPLGRDALAELVDSLDLPGVHGRLLAPGLLQRTGGNPLYVLETLKQAWVDNTLAQLADAQQLPRPLSVGRLIERRIAQLSPAALALARVASVAGVDFGIGLAERVLGVSAMQFADALNELEAAQVLRDTQFAHDLVFDAVRASVPPAIARHTHAGVAAWLEAHGGEPARIARHWVDGAQPTRALGWLEQAAQAAAVAVRRKEQFAFLREKADIEAASGDAPAAFESLMRACELLDTFDSEGALGLVLCDQLEGLAQNPDQQVCALTQRASLAVQRGDAEAAEAAAASAHRLALRHGVAPAVMFECRNQLATALCLLGRLPEAIGQFEAMLGWIDEHADDAARCDFHGNLAMTYDSAGRLGASVPHHELAIELARRSHDHGNLTQTTANYACNRILGGRLAEGEALLARARQLRAHDELPASIDGFIAMTQALCDYQGGRYAAALGALDEGLDRLAEFAPGYRPVAVVHQAVCWSHLGQWARMAQAIDSLGDLATMSSASRLRVLLLRHQMALALAQPTDASRLSDAVALAEHARLPDIAHALLLEAAAALAPADALRQCEEVIASAEALGQDATRLAAHAQAARAAALCGDAPRARGHVDAKTALAGRVTVVRQYRMEPSWHAAFALHHIGDAARAQALAADACGWIDDTARRHVPAAFRESFLNRNPVNRSLIAMAARERG